MFAAIPAISVSSWLRVQATHLRLFESSLQPRRPSLSLYPGSSLLRIAIICSSPFRPSCSRKSRMRE